MKPMLSWPLRPLSRHRVESSRVQWDEFMAVKLVRVEGTTVRAGKLTPAATVDVANTTSKCSFFIMVS
jgi:hypothetical protein